MPREYTHWIILEDIRVAAAKHGLSYAAKITEDNIAAASIGAIVADSPYYFQYGKNRVATQIGDCYHGSAGEDTLSPIKLLAAEVLKRSENKERELGWAIIIGMLSHIYADSIFHPLVNFISGNWYAAADSERIPARRRHKIFEVYLDSWVRAQRQLWNGGRLATSMQRLPSKSAIYQFVSSSYNSEIPNSMNAALFWQSCLEYQTVMQSRFLSTGFGALIRLLYYVGMESLAESDALFSFGRKTYKTIFDSPFTYQHPITGSQHTHTIRDLWGLSVDGCVKHLQRIEPLLSGKSEDLTLIGVHGVSLDYGLPRVKSSDATFFRDGKDFPF